MAFYLWSYLAPHRIGGGGFGDVKTKKKNGERRRVDSDGSGGATMRFTVVMTEHNGRGLTVGREMSSRKHKK